MGLDEMSLRSRVYPNACQSGDTRFFVAPGNQLAYVDKLHIDTAYASGQFGAIQVQVRDSFMPMGGVSASILRFETHVLGGDVVEIPMEREVVIFGGADVRTNFSGPIVALGALFR